MPLFVKSKIFALVAAGTASACALEHTDDVMASVEGAIYVATSPDASDGGADGGEVLRDIADPASDGPFAFAETDVSVPATTADPLALHVVHPTSGPDAGPYPVVFIAPAFQIAASQYIGYAKRLATHGIVGVTVEYPQQLDRKQLRDAQNLEAALSWAASGPGAALSGKLDAARVGVMGHSRGGKAAVLAALRDSRFKAVLGLDPIDSKPPFGSCPTADCPDASEEIRLLTVPSAFLGETTDATPSFGAACAPAADNYTTFFDGAPAPSLEVTIAGANHVSFVGDLQSCGFTCMFCKPSTRPQAEVLSVAYAYTAAFFRRHLSSESAYDDFLTGPTAQARYVATGIVMLRTK